MKLSIIKSRDYNHDYFKERLVNSVLIFLSVYSFSAMTAIPLIEAQIPIAGSQCPIKTPSIPIDIKQITGTWYEVEATPTFLEYPFKCISIKVASFYEKKSEISIDAVNRMTKEFGTIQKLSAEIPESSNEKDGVINLTMLPESTSRDGDLIYGPHLRENYQHLPIQILATDYNNWAVAWMCKKHEGAHIEFLWVLSRQRTLTADQYQAIVEVKRVHNLESINVRDTIQERCSKQQENEVPKIEGYDDEDVNVEDDEDED